jgi:hypothetical protein
MFRVFFFFPLSFSFFSRSSGQLVIIREREHWSLGRYSKVCGESVPFLLKFIYSLIYVCRPQIQPSAH